MRKQNGFSVLELLIVIAIVLVLAAIAIPNLLQGRMAANEASAAASVTQINTAQVSYSTAYPDTGYAANLAQLSGDGTACGAEHATSTHACLIDSVLGAGKKSGYLFSISGGAEIPNLGYSVNAEPITRGLTGQLSFYSDQTGVIRANQGDASGPSAGASAARNKARRNHAASTHPQSQSSAVSVMR
ncbi:conserved hypothetical protein [Candidatus Koribacter versatilis Ellin345]|uniref:Pili assembly chaperone n=1 Tax=Koribacter versatilis (strain Ellin345) TaxID=204669 RepID=Q1INV1_KORVE|nr:type II secretion system protein [Candidatus Koribacter versatilis]ABF41449.1 conserved hypothetical protein [Candidatus Koribacter versatilis Ellin345]